MEVNVNVEPIRPNNRIEGCVDHFVTQLGKQKHVTPKIKKKAGQVQLEQKVGRVRRQSKQLNTNQLSTPAADEEGRHVGVRKKPISKKSGRKLFSSTSAAKTISQESSNGAVTCTDSVEDFDCRADEACSLLPVTPSHPTPVHSGSQVPGQMGVKHLRDPQETEAPSSEKKLGSKRRRLYSQPVGVIEPAGSASDSQNGDNPSTALVPRPKPSDTASRANESVYDQLLEHSAQKSNRGGGRSSRKVPRGRKSAPPRVRSITAAPPVPAATRSSPRPPRRRAAAAAVSHLRDSTSDNGGVTSQTSGEASEGEPQPGSSSPQSGGDGTKAAGGSPQSVAEASLQDDGPSEELERGDTEIFYLPTVVRSDDDDSDQDVFEECADPPAGGKRAVGAGGRVVSDATERDSSSAASEHDQEPNADSQSSPETSHQRQDQRASQMRKSAADSNVPASPRRPDNPAQSDRRSDRRFYHRSSVSAGEMNNDPSWIGSGRRISKRRSCVERATCYSHARPESPDSILRRHSYLSATMPDRRERSGLQGRHSSSRGQRDSGQRLSTGRGSRSSPRSAARPFFSVDPDTETTSPVEVNAGGSRPSPRSAARPFFSVDPDTGTTSPVEVGARGGRLSPRSAARPFFSVDPDTETTSPVEVGTSGAEASASDSISRHTLVVEQDPYWYRNPRRELGPNVSSESSATRRQQERSQPRQPGRRIAPKVYLREDGRQPSGAAPWRHSMVPTSRSGPSSTATRPSSSATRPSSTATRPSSSATRPSSTATRPSSSANRPSSSANRPSSTATRPSSAVARPGAVTRRAGDGAGQRSPAQPAMAPSRSCRQLDLQEPGQAAAGQEGSGRTGSPEHVYQDDAEPDVAWSEAEPMEALSVAEQSDNSVSEHPIPTFPQPVMSGPHPVPSGRPKPIPSGPHDTFPSGPHTFPSGPLDNFPSSSQPVPSGPHTILSDPAPFSSNPYHVTLGPHFVPSGSRPIPSGPQPTPAGPQSFSSGTQRFPCDPRPFPPGPRPGPNTSIGSELARLVVRWRQLAKLEHQIFSVLRTAQHRQQALMDVQRRIRAARLQQGKRTRAGILAACDAPERLAGWA